jgi:hypothetical protein
MSTYVDPTQGVEVPLVNKRGGNTYDPPAGSDWWECPFCDNAGSYEGLRRHLSADHNLRVVESTITVRVNRMYDDDGQLVRYVEDVAVCAP